MLSDDAPQEQTEHSGQNGGREDDVEDQDDVHLGLVSESNWSMRPKLGVSRPAAIGQPPYLGS